MQRTVGLAIVILAVTALGAATCTCSPEEDAEMGEKLEVGAEAPLFSLPGSDGKTYSLEEFRGKQAVVIAWFPKAFTGG